MCQAQISFEMNDEVDQENNVDEVTHARDVSIEGSLEIADEQQQLESEATESPENGNPYPSSKFLATWLLESYFKLIFCFDINTE